MKMCIPVVSPEGLSSRIESDPAGARFLHFFDSETESFEEIDLAVAEVPPKAFDAVICTQIGRHVFSALRERGVDVYLCEAETVQEALRDFQTGSVYRIPDEAGGCGGGCHSGSESGGCGGGCHGAEAHEGSGCGCQSEAKDHGCGSGGCGSGAHDHAHDHGHGGCGCSGHGSAGAGTESPVAKRVLSPDGALKIAVTSQNRKTVTEHAGKCRKFWIYETQNGRVLSKSLLELTLEQSLHEWDSAEAHPLADVDLLITASAGDGMKTRLAGWGIEVVVTDQTDPDAVVSDLLSTVNG